GSLLVAGLLRSGLALNSPKIKILFKTFDVGLDLDSVVHQPRDNLSKSNTARHSDRARTDILS
ncbi:hypothetical protein KI387_033845, partial [Taxus chinensis]